MKSYKMAQGWRGRIRPRLRVRVLPLCVLSTLLAIVLLTSKSVTESSAKAAGNSPIGPYTEILIPFGDLPALNEDLAYHPVIDQYESGATLQVMYVLEDPRDVPMAEA